MEASTYCAFSGTPNCYCDSMLASRAWDVSNEGRKGMRNWNTCT